MILSLTAFVYCFTIFQNEFTTWDDNRYITENKLLQEGSLSELISQPFDGHFHPVTMLSLKIDYLIGGLKPFMFQATNVFLHLLNTLLVFKLLSKLFNDTKMALLVAALFGLATVNVESVVWMSERKNVLSTFFYLMTALYYLKSNNSIKYFLLSLVFFTLGIFSKVTVVSLVPCLFLFDYYIKNQFFIDLKKKIPFIVLAVVFGLIAVSAQSDLQVESLSSSFDTMEKFAMSSYALTMYLIKPFYPFGMSTIYPYPITESAIELYSYYIIVPLLLLITLTFLYIKKQKTAFFGLLFFSFNIILLLKFFDFPLGDYILADRYDYIPMIGLGIFVYGLVQKIFKKSIFGIISMLLITALNIPLTVIQIQTWKNDLTLFSRVLENYPNSDIALNNRGIQYMNHHENKKAMSFFKKAYRNNSNNYEANLNLANLLALDNQSTAALKVYNTTIKNSPNVPRAYYNRGIYFFMQKEYELAYSDAIEAKKLDPNYPNIEVLIEEIRLPLFELKFQKGLQHAYKNELKEAIMEFSYAAKLNPQNTSNSENLALAKKKYFALLTNEGITLGEAGNIDAAIAKFNEILLIEPLNKEAKSNIAYANSLKN